MTITDRNDIRKTLQEKTDLRFFGELKPPDVVEDQDGSIDYGDIKTTYLLSSEFCPSCDDLKESLVDEITAGDIMVVDIDSDFGEVLADEVGSIAVPSLVVELSDGLRFELRYDDDEDDVDFEGDGVYGEEDDTEHID